MATTLRKIAAAGTALALLGLTACSSSSADSEDVAGSASSAQGGTVRVGIMGAPGDPLDVTMASSFFSYGVSLNLFDSLVVMSQGQTELVLAESITPNEDATEWTIAIHDDVKFTDGSDVTADDVLASLKYLAVAPNYGSMFADFDFDNASSDGDLTVKLPMAKPRADLVESILAQISIVFPEGMTDFTKAIGSGPFKLESYDPDTGVVLARNDDYWGGAPALERLEFLPIADATARLTAVASDQLDYAMGVTATGAQTIQKGSGVVVQDPGPAESNAFTFMLNPNKAPFNDPEVRDAFRLAVDRQALVDVVFRGRGTVGNDIVGKGMVGYDDSIEQRQRDIDKATEVFKAKGVTSISVLASEMTPGITDAAKLLAQQLQEAGVDVTVTEVDPTALFADLSTIPANDVFSFYAINRPIAAHIPMFSVDGAPGNYLGGTNSELTEVITASQATSDEPERTRLLDKAQEILWTSGPDTVWGFQPVLSAHDEKLSGVEIIQSVPVFTHASYQA